MCPRCCRWPIGGLLGGGEAEHGGPRGALREAVRGGEERERGGAHARRVHEEQRAEALRDEVAHLARREVPRSLRKSRLKSLNIWCAYDKNMIKFTLCNWDNLCLRNVVI